MDREIFRENALEQKKKKRGLKFNLGLVLIGLQTTEPRGKLNKTFHVWQLPQKVEFKTTFKRISLHEWTLGITTDGKPCPRQQANVIDNFYLHFSTYL